jgi:hypothetical protein
MPLNLSLSTALQCRMTDAINAERKQEPLKEKKNLSPSGLTPYRSFFFGSVETKVQRVFSFGVIGPYPLRGLRFRFRFKG